MVASDAAVLDALSLRQKLCSELFACINPIVGAVVSHADTDGGCFLFKLKFGLYRFNSSETDLVHDGNLTAGGIAKESASAELLGGDRVSTACKLPSLETRLILIGKHEITRLQFIELQKAVLLGHGFSASFRSTLLLAELA